MSIYIVVDEGKRTEQIQGVFTDHEKAQAYADAENEGAWEPTCCVYVWDIDDALDLLAMYEDGLRKYEVLFSEKGAVEHAKRGRGIPHEPDIDPVRCGVGGRGRRVSVIAPNDVEAIALARQALTESEKEPA